MQNFGQQTVDRLTLGNMKSASRCSDGIASFDFVREYAIPLPDVSPQFSTFSIPPANAFFTAKTRATMTNNFVVIETILYKFCESSNPEKRKTKIQSIRCLFSGVNYQK